MQRKLCELLFLCATESILVGVGKQLEIGIQIRSSKLRTDCVNRIDTVCESFRHSVSKIKTHSLPLHELARNEACAIFVRGREVCVWFFVMKGEYCSVTRFGHHDVSQGR